MAPSATATRSVVVGLLLAVFSAGCLIAFSLFAGDADNPTGSTVSASRPDGEVPAVVLGTRLSRTGDEKPVDSPPSSVTLAEVLQPLVVEDDAVLGTQLRNEPEKSTDGKRKQRTDPRKDRDGRRDKDGLRRSDDKGPVTGRHVAARTASSPGCPCKSKSKSDHSPNGHAYGHDKQTPANNGSNGLARGHDKGNANSQGKAKGKSK